MPLITSQVLDNRYRIVKLLGQGGFGAVYRAWDLKLNAPCAIKESYDISPEAVRQFAREASLLANLRHSGLPKVTDHFSVPGQGQYLVMEYIEGQDLQQLLDQAGGPLPQEQVLSWIGQVLDALVYLHSRQPPVIHRDIKPANIKITDEGQAVLVDFGIAKVFDPRLRTSTGARAITPGFSPFEQYTQEGTDPRSDVYALGATMYALLTCNVPPESINRLAGTLLPSPRSLNPKLSTALESVVLKAISIQPADRYIDASEMKSALQSVQLSTPAIAIPVQSASTGMNSPVSIYTSVTQAPAAPARPNHRWLFALSALLLIFILGFGIYWLGQNKTPSEPNPTPIHTTTLPMLVEISPSATLSNIPTQIQTISSTPSPTPTLFSISSPITPTLSTTMTPKSGLVLLKGWTCDSSACTFKFEFAAGENYIVGALHSRTGDCQDRDVMNLVLSNASTTILSDSGSAPSFRFASPTTGTLSIRVSSTVCKGFYVGVYR